MWLTKEYIVESKGGEGMVDGLAKKSRVAGQPKSMQTELINHVRQSCWKFHF